MNTSEVTQFDLNARRRMIFQYLRLSASLEAFRNDICAGRRRWWI